MSVEIEEMLRRHAQQLDRLAPDMTAEEVRARAEQLAAGDGAGGATTSPNGSRPERAYLIEPPDHQIVALARHRAPRRRAIAILAAVAAVIAVTVAVAVTRPSAHGQLKPVVPAHLPATTMPLPPTTTPLPATTTPLPPPSAQPQLYWSDPTGIGRANVTGTDAVPGVIPSTDFAAVCGVAVDRNYIYWTADDRVARVKRDGTDLEPKFIDLTGTPQACFLAVDDAHIYWGSQGSGIGRANLDGTGVKQAFIQGAAMAVCGIAVDSGHIYWGDQNSSSIARANLDGTDVNRNFITVTGSHPGPGMPPACNPLVDGAYIYWGAPDTIARANLDGTGVNNSFIRAPGLFSGEVPNLCAHDATYLYWTDVALDLVQPGSSTTSWVGRTSLEGTDVRPHFMSVESPTGCAVGPP